MPNRTGGKIPGRERLALTAVASDPRSCTTTSARVRLAETQKKGIQVSSNVRSPRYRSDSSSWRTFRAEL